MGALPNLQYKTEKGLTAYMHEDKKEMVLYTAFLDPLC